MLKSQESNIRSFVRFKNGSKRNVDVNWVNFLGETIQYTNIPPGYEADINTFVTHPWVFKCSQTGERLHVNNSEVFQAEPWFKYINNAVNGVVSVGRQVVKIHYPLRSLRDICLWELVFLVETKNEIYDLEIPHSLKVDLLRNFRSSSRYEEEERSDRFIM